MRSISRFDQANCSRMQNRAWKIEKFWSKRKSTQWQGNFQFFSSFVNIFTTKNSFWNFLKDHNLVSSIVAEKGLGNNLTTMDIENIASLVQGELQTIRQIILQNHSLIKTMKLRTNGELSFHFYYKMGCVFAIVSVLPDAVLGPNDHRKVAPHFN